MLIGHREEIRKLTFRALALRRSEGLPLETSAFESLYGGQFMMEKRQVITSLCSMKYYVSKTCFSSSETQGQLVGTTIFLCESCYFWARVCIKSGIALDVNLSPKISRCHDYLPLGFRVCAF